MHNLSLERSTAGPEIRPSLNDSAVEAMRMLEQGVTDQGSYHNISKCRSLIHFAFKLFLCNVFFIFRGSGFAAAEEVTTSTAWHCAQLGPVWGFVAALAHSFSIRPPRNAPPLVWALGLRLDGCDCRADFSFLETSQVTRASLVWPMLEAAASGPD